MAYTNARDEEARSEGRYGQGKRFNPVVVLLVIAVHAAVFALVSQLGPRFTRSEAAQIFTVNLIPAPPAPPPAEQAPPPPSRRPDVVVPKPRVEVPSINAPLVIARPQMPVAPLLPVSVPARVPAPAPVRPAVPSVADGGDLGTRMVAGKPPRYPIESRRKREEGVVLLALTVGLDGRVDEIRIARSSGFRRLDKAALEAVRRWRWAPTIHGGEAVLVRGVVEIPFVLQKSDHV